MVNDVEVRKAIIDKLLTDLTVVGFTTDIRESEYQGKQIAYPNLRVKIVYSQPRENGICREEKSVASFSVASFSDDDSSVQCANLAHAATEALFGKLLSGPGFRTLRVNKRGRTGPYRHSPRLWRSDAHFWVHIYETS